MQALYRTALVDDLSAHWCNADAVATSMLEAVSLVTPALEQFQIRTVAEALAAQTDAGLRHRGQRFIAEESSHARTHVKFNSVLAGHLGGLPPGIAVVRWMLRLVRRYGSPGQRLLMVAALEHVTAVVSSVYLAHEPDLRFTSPFARQLFAQHAQEELAHRSVAFDLWMRAGTAGGVVRSLTLLAILCIAGVYALFAVPWVLRRKTGRRQPLQLPRLCVRVVTTPQWAAQHRAAARALFAFVRHDFHPDDPTHDRPA